MSAATKRTHRCAADGCDERCDRTMLMCKPHWFKVPKSLRDEIQRAYRNDGVLSKSYLDSVEAAREALRG